MIYRVAIIVTLLLFISAGAAVADTLALKDGKIYHGKVLKQTKDEVEFEIYKLGGKLKFTKTFKMKNVRSITEGKIEVEVQKTKPTSKPTTKPESRPTTKPPAGPLATPDTLAEELRKNIPTHPSEDKATWETLTILQKEEAEKKYQQKLEKHKKKNDFRGKAVSWVLRVSDIKKAKKGRRRGNEKSFIVTTKSRKGSIVTATVSTTAKDDLLKLKKGDRIRVRGIIADYNFVKPSYRKRTVFHVAIKDAGVMLSNDIPQAAMFGHDLEAKKIIFLIDSSGSMVDIMDIVRKEVKLSVSRLKPEQEFAVVFFKNAKKPANIVLKKATDKNKASAMQQAQQVRAGGFDHMLPYLVKALKALAQSKKGGTVCLVTDGIAEVDEAKKILKAIKKHNRYNKVSINTFLIGNSNEESAEYLQAIADLTGGEFFHIDPEE